MAKVKFKVEATYRYKGELEIDEEDADAFESKPTSFADFYSVNDDPVLLDWKIKRNK